MTIATWHQARRSAPCARALYRGRNSGKCYGLRCFAARTLIPPQNTALFSWSTVRLSTLEVGLSLGKPWKSWRGALLYATVRQDRGCSTSPVCCSATVLFCCFAAHNGCRVFLPTVACYVKGNPLLTAHSTASYICARTAVARELRLCSLCAA